MSRCFLTVLFAAALLCAGVTPAFAQVPPVPPLPPAQTPATPPAQTPATPPTQTPANPPAQVPAAPQAPAPVVAPQSEIGGCKVSEMQGATQEVLSKEFEGKTEKVIVLTGTGALSVRLDCDQMQFFAEFVEIYQERNRVVATGNVTFVSNNSRISAERMEFDTKTRTGTFYVAHGWATLSEQVDRSMFGTQEPDAQFRGREIRKLGPTKYEIVDGAFTTCVQPTPRWEIVSGKATLKLDDYALLKNSVFRVKGVPLMYMPLFYYPIEEDDRSTGFLIPIYGSSTNMGQSWSFPFFWAISRSQDATVEYDWSSKAGQTVGGEYRYVLGPGARGQATTYVLDQKDQTNTAGTMIPGTRSYRIDGSLVQPLGHGLRAQANADYFSSIANEQLYQQDPYRATQSRRGFGANISGNWRQYVLNSTFNRNDTFFNDQIITDGNLPRVNFSRAEQRIATSPFYFGFGTEFATMLRSTDFGPANIPDTDQGLSRFDLSPGVRIPFTKWPFLTVNSTVSWRATYWSESLDANNLQVPESVTRQYFDLNARITGPVFSRIFNASNDPEARKLKHVIEPVFSIGRTTAIDNLDRIVKLDGNDYTVGNTTRIVYGLNNRLYSKRKVAREVLSVVVEQSYYSEPAAQNADPNYQSSYNGLRAPTNFSTVRMSVRTTPNDRFQTDVRTEFDAKEKAFLLFNVNGIVNSTHVQSSIGWTRLRVLPAQITLPPQTTSHYLVATTNFRTANNHLGGTYALNYDILGTAFLQQRIFAYYNAQCCGVLAEYQVWNYPFATVPKDKRFNVSFTLAGIGTFSNFLGAFGAKTGR